MRDVLNVEESSVGDLGDVRPESFSIVAHHIVQNYESDPMQCIFTYFFFLQTSPEFFFTSSSSVVFC